MSKHLKALGKLKKNVLGLTTANLDTEITSLGKRRDKLPTLIYEKTDEATAAEVLANMVDKYHLKEASLIKKEVKDKLTGNITTTLDFPSSMEVTTFINTINEELSAKCETQIVIDSAKKRVEGFFSVENSGMMNLNLVQQPIGEVYGPISGGIDGDTTSSILNYQSFKNNAYNYADSSKYLHFINLVEKGDLKLELKLPTEKSFAVVERLALAYRDTYIKNYTEYLPDFAQLKYFLNQELEYEFGKYEPIGVDEELDKGEISDIEKLKSKYSNFTNDIIDTLSYLFYGDLSKSKRIDNIERYRKNKSIAVLNLGKQNDNSKNIVKTYGESNLIVVKNELNSLNKENDDIDKKIEVLQTEKTTISEVEVERREQTEDLDELLGGVDTTFIDKAGLSDGSIISAQSAHTETLKIYSGARVDKIIKEAIVKGDFEVELFELTDIEAKLLLNAGYYIKETTEPIKKGNKVVQKTTWTINWESANSILGEEPKEPLP